MTAVEIGIYKADKIVQYVGNPLIHWLQQEATE